MAQRDASKQGVPTLDGVLAFFEWKWTGFWAWLDSIGQNVQPVPTVRPVDTSAPERPETQSPPK